MAELEEAAEVNLPEAVAAEPLEEDHQALLQQEDQEELEELYLLLDHLQPHQVVEVAAVTEDVEPEDLAVEVKEVDQQVHRLKLDKLIPAVAAAEVVDKIQDQEAKPEVAVK